MLPPPYGGGVLGGRHSQLGGMSLGAKLRTFDLIMATPGLVSFYPCDEASGAPVIHDIVGGNDLTFDSGTTAYENSVSKPAGPESVALFFPTSGAPVLPGGTNHDGWKGQQDRSLQASWTAASAPSLTTFSFEYWFAPSEFGDPAGVMETAPGIFDSYPAVQYPVFAFGGYVSEGTNTDLFNVVGDAGLVNQGNFSQRPFSYWTYTYDGTSFKGYLNGVLKSTITSGIPTITDKLNVGLCGGLMYGMALYNRALTAAEVAGRATLTDPSILTSARTTQMFAEVIRSANRTGRVSQMFAEVLCDIPHSTFSVSATTSFTVGATCSEIVGSVISVSAASSFSLTATSAERVGHQLSVSASSSITLSPSTAGYVPAIHTVSASNSFNVEGSGTAVVHNPTPYMVSAASSFNFSPSARIGLARSISLSATTSFIFAGRGFAPSSFSVSAKSGLVWSHGGQGTLSYLFVSASSGLVFKGTAPHPISFGVKFVSAATGFILAGTSTEIANLNLNVSASSGIVFAGIDGTVKRGPLLVAATTQFQVSQAVSYTNPGPRNVSASTNMILSTTATTTRSAILLVSASTVFSISSLGAENAAMGVSASSGVIFSSAARQNRAILVAATTSLGLSNAPKTGNLKTASAESTFTFVSSAGLHVTGTEAESGLVFTDLAQAVVWIPWRRAALTLPAGGNLPHS